MHTTSLCFLDTPCDRCHIGGGGLCRLPGGSGRMWPRGVGHPSLSLIIGLGTSLPQGCWALPPLCLWGQVLGSSSHCVAELPPLGGSRWPRKGWTGWDIAEDISPFGVGAETRASPFPVIFICMKICGKWIPDLALQGVHSLSPNSCPPHPHSFQCTLHPGPNLAMQHVWLWLK